MLRCRLVNGIHSCVSPDFLRCFCSGRRIQNKDKEIKCSVKGREKKREKWQCQEEGTNQTRPTLDWQSGWDDGRYSLVVSAQPIGPDHWALPRPGFLCHPAYLRCLLV